MAATYLYLESGEVSWQISVDDQGILSSEPVEFHAPDAVEIIGVDRAGRLTLDPLGGLDRELSIISSPNGILYVIGITASGVLKTQSLVVPTRLDISEISWT
jgi:hypothetical protein